MGMRKPDEGWKKVIFAADCGVDEETGEPGEICPQCKKVYADDCTCPGPTQDGMEYTTFDDILFARPIIEP
jgi:hypothetical protein